MPRKMGLPSLSLRSFPPYALSQALWAAGLTGEHDWAEPERVERLQAAGLSQTPGNSKAKWGDEDSNIVVTVRLL